MIAPKLGGELGYMERAVVSLRAWKDPMFTRLWRRLWRSIDRPFWTLHSLVRDGLSEDLDPRSD